MSQRPPPETVFTIGHSTRSIDELIALLRTHGVRLLADVRTVSRSRRFPHFNAESLADSLPVAGIAYLPSKPLGGLRKPQPDSINTGWKNESFRGYADYMQTAEFDRALAALMGEAARQPTAIMCAEAVPWKCHRSLIADALAIRGWNVLHILGADDARPHQVTAFARVDGEAITYPEPSLFSAEGPY